MAEQGRGVQFEWAIIYHFIKKTLGKKNQRLSEYRLRRNPELVHYGEGIMSLSGSQVADNILNAFQDITELYHSDELRIEGNPEPKTDILTKDGKYKFSVKMNGDVQLSSSEGRGSAKLFEVARDSLIRELGLEGRISVEDINKLIAFFKNSFPTKMLEKGNIKKALSRKPDIARPMLDFSPKSAHDKGPYILEEYDWTKWKEIHRKPLKEWIEAIFDKNPEYAKEVVKTSLTGEGLFSDTLSVSNFMLTPDKIKVIDKDYIEGVYDKIKFDVRAKSRAGITSVVLRLDLKMEKKGR